MFQKTIKHPLFQFAYTAAVAVGVAVSVYPKKLPGGDWGSQYAIHLMLFYLAAGIIMLLLKQPRLTFISFTGCLALSFFLKYSIRESGIERWRQTVMLKNTPGKPWTPAFKHAHINLSNLSTPEEFMQTVKNAGADILSFHEFTPDWANWLRDSLRQEYPHSHELVDIGIFGMAFFSKYRLKDVDTSYFHKIPVLHYFLNIGGKDVELVSLHTEPAVNEYSRQRLKEHLEQVAAELRSINRPLLVFGDFNAVTWSPELRSFMAATGLLESRTGFLTSGIPPDIPLNHIFYSPDFICSDFSILRSPVSRSRQLGIAGKFYFKL